MKYIRLFLAMLLVILIIPREITKKSYIYSIDLSKVNTLVVFNEIKTQEELKQQEKESNINDLLVVNDNIQPLSIFYGTITGYEPNCEGCIGITSSGYDVRNTMYYYDDDYGNIRIIAADPSIEFGTIIQISNISSNNSIIAIVLDRGSAIGFNALSQADLLFENEADALLFGRQSNIKFAILRNGF